MSVSANQIQSILSQAQSTQHDSGYQIQILNNYQQLIDSVKKENYTINATYIDGISVNSANSQQSKYVIQSSTILGNLNKYGFWIYLILGFLLSAIIIMKPMNMYYKFILVFFILTYPFYIYPLEEFTYRISKYLSDLTMSIAYNTGYGNTSLEYGITELTGAYDSSLPVPGAVGSTGSTGAPGSGSEEDENNYSSNSRNSRWWNWLRSRRTTPPLPTPQNTATPTPTLSNLSFASTEGETAANFSPDESWTQPPADAPATIDNPPTEEPDPTVAAVTVAAV